MGGQLEDTQKASQRPIRTYFRELYSYFLSIGMSREEFWDDDVELINDYIKAENIRQVKINNQLWLQGAYFQMAIASCFSKSSKYPKQPLPLTEYEIENTKKQKVQKLKQALIAKSKK